MSTGIYSCRECDTDFVDQPCPCCGQPGIPLPSFAAPPEAGGPGPAGEAEQPAMTLPCGCGLSENGGIVSWCAEDGQ